MTFLNPFLLVGLAAAAIPIIIHLLNLRKLKTVEFSSLQFLKELQKTKMRRVKIKQWLLLALRTLLILALVFAFARPALRGSLLGSVGTHAKTTSVILLDDSPSMNVRNERGVLFTQARDAAAHIVEMMREGDEAYLVRLSEIGRTETFSAAHSADVLKTALAGMQPAQSTTSYRDALAVAARLLAESNNFNQEVYLLTDGQGTQFSLPSEVADTLRLFSDRTRLFIAEVASPARNNTAITDVTVTSRIISPDKPVGVQVVIRNFGAAAIVNGLMSIYLDGIRVVQQTIDVPAQGSVTTSVSAIPKRRGAIPGYVQIEDDALEIDNTRSFIVHVPTDLAVLFVGPEESDVRLPHLALTLDGDSLGRSAFRTRTIPESQLSSTDIARFDAIVLCGVKDFSPTEAERITSFMRAGGGIILFPGNESDLDNYNSDLFKNLDIPPLVGMPTGNVPDQSSYVTFSNVDLAHPLFSGLFESQSGGKQVPAALESPHVYRNVTPANGETGQSVIMLSNGAGFLTEYHVGSGRMLLFSVEAGLSWSDFPVKGLFVPLLHRSVLYLAAQNQLPPTFVVGESMKLAVRIQAGEQRASYLLRSPGGIEEKVIPGMFSASGVALFTSSFATETGVYELRRQPEQENQRQNVLQAVAVNLNPNESDLHRVSKDDLRHFWARMGVTEQQVQELSTEQEINATVLESRFGVELWKYFLVLALLCALAEMIIGREAKGTA